MTNKLYIAYGSNINVEQMAMRCPKATIYSTGILENYELVFKGLPMNAHATILPKEGSQIPVLLWHLDPDSEQALDIYEHYPTYYIKEMLPVTTAQGITEGMAYIMVDSESYGQPSDAYYERIQHGYERFDFDDTILQQGRQVSAQRQSLQS